MTQITEVQLLREELKRILGRYEFRQAPVAYLPTQTDNAFVDSTIFHETQHLELCTFSSHGMLQRLLASVLAQDDLPHDLRGALGGLLDASISVSFDVHEGIATTLQRHLIELVGGSDAADRFWAAKPASYQAAANLFEPAYKLWACTSLGAMADRFVSNIANSAMNTQILSTPLGLAEIVTKAPSEFFPPSLSPDRRVRDLLGVFAENDRVTDLATRVLDRLRGVGLVEQTENDPLKARRTVEEQIPIQVVMGVLMWEYIASIWPDYYGLRDEQRASDFERLVSGWSKQLVQRGCEPLPNADAICPQPSGPLQANLVSYEADIVPERIRFGDLRDMGVCVPRYVALTLAVNRRVRPDVRFYVHPFPPTLDGNCPLNLCNNIPKLLPMYVRTMRTLDHHERSADNRQTWWGQDVEVSKVVDFCTECQKHNVPYESVSGLLSQLPEDGCHISTAFGYFWVKEWALLTEAACRKRRVYAYLGGGSMRKLVIPVGLYESDVRVSTVITEYGIMYVFQEFLSVCGPIMFCPTTIATYQRFEEVVGRDESLGPRIEWAGVVTHGEPMFDEWMDIALHYDRFGF